MEDLTGVAGTMLLLVAVRLGVALRLIPLLGGRPLPWIAWAALAAALLPVVAHQVPVSESVIDGWTVLALLAAGEVMVGACLGLAVRLALSVFEIAGAAADVAGRAIPAGGGGAEPGGPYRALFTTVGVAVFLAAGGHRALIASLAGSFALLPAGGGFQSLAAGIDVAVIAGGAFLAAVAVAGPLFLAGLAADLSVALWARAEPGVGAGIATGSARALAVHVAMLAFLAAGLFLAADAAQEGIAVIVRAFPLNSS